MNMNFDFIIIFIFIIIACGKNSIALICTNQIHLHNAFSELTPIILNHDRFVLPMIYI
jgi:hypothetical protein